MQIYCLDLCNLSLQPIAECICHRLITKKTPDLCQTFLVRRMRLELTRSCDHYPLKVACIPISPPALRRNWLATKNDALRILVAAIPPF